MPAQRSVRRRRKPERSARTLILQGVGLAAVLTGSYWLARLAHSSEAVRVTVASYGYVGVLIVSFISGLNIVVPIPAVAFLPVFIESGLVFGLTVVVMSAGMTMADMVAYGFGSLGRKAYEAAYGSRSNIRRLERWRTRHRLGPFLGLLLFASFAPLPNEMLVVPMGIMGYRMRDILPIVFVGNIAFNAIYAQGVVRLFGLM